MTKIVTLTVNPAVDVSTSVDRLEPVRKLRCRRERREAGGGGVNVARVLSRFGADVTAVHTAGGVTGQMLSELLAREAVAARYVPVHGMTRESFTVRDETTQEEYRFVLPGPELSEGDWDRCMDEALMAAVGESYIVASGSLAPGVPDDGYARLARASDRARQRVVIDVSGQPLKLALEAGVYLVKPNLRELQDLLGSRLEDRRSQVDACRSLIRSGAARIIALSLGSHGALLVTPEGAWFSEPLPVSVQSSVGAGDSFLGGLLWSLAQDRDLPSALAFAVAAGSAALLAPGTQLCRPQDVHRLVPDVRVTALPADG